MRPNRLSAVFVLALAGSALVAPAASAQSAFAPFTAPPAAAPKAADRVDRDGDGMYESLETKLAGVAADDTVRVIVTLGDEASAARVRALEQAVGNFDLGRRFDIIDAFSASVPKRLIPKLAAQGIVEHIEEDAIVRVQNGGSQTMFGVAAAKVQVPGLDGNADGSPAYSGGDLVAVVIDSGVDGSHAALDGGKLLVFKDYVKLGGAQTAPYDDNGHGTHVAGTIAGDGDGSPDGADRGVAPGAALIGLKTMGADGKGSSTANIAAVQWSVANKAAYGIEVVNLSLGFAGCNPGNDAMSQAVNAAHQAGLVMAVAAGNSGPAPCTVGSPGTAENALTVGNMADPTKAAYFQQVISSSRGPTQDGRTKPDVSAPGYQISSAATNTGNGYTALTGTSMATPFVAGLALLMIERNPGLTPQQVKDTIKSTAVDWGAPGADNEYGSGRLDGYAALSAVGAALTDPPAGVPHFARSGSLAPGGTMDIPVEGIGGMIGVTSIETTPGVNFSVEILKGTKETSPAAAWSNNGRQDSASEWLLEAGTKRWIRVRSLAGAGSFSLDVTGAAESAVDATPAETSITSSTNEGGSGWSSTDSISFYFASPEPGVTFQCSLDGAPFAECISPKSYFGLAEGERTFEVRALDGWGNADPSPAKRTWKVDTTDPVATITGGPEGTADTADASFQFESNDPSATMMCNIDSQPYAACTSPKALTGLSEGPHTFRVWATDPAGNFGVAERTWTVDAMPPDTIIETAEPKGLTRLTRVDFRFKSTEEPSTMECKLDAGAWQACAPDWDHGHSFLNLADGPHTVLVRATKNGRTDPTPASHTWTIDTVAPETTITAAPAEKVNTANVSFAFTATEAGSVFACVLKGQPAAPCTSPKSYTMPEGLHWMDVAATDPAGNTDKTPAFARWEFSTYVPPTQTGQNPPPGYVPPGSQGPPPGYVPPGYVPPGSVPPGATTPPNLGGGQPGGNTPELQATLNAASQRLANVLRKGVVVNVGCSLGCTARISLEQKGVRKAMLLGVRAVVIPGPGGLVRSTVKLGSAAKKTLKKLKKPPTLLIKAEFLDPFGNRKTVSSQVKLKR